MARVLHTEIERLKQQAVSVGAKVESALRDAVRAFHERDAELAKRVKEADTEIDRLEVDVEEECLKTLALHQPVAGDLRLIIAVIKMNNDLERIGDLAADLAERAHYLSKRDPIPIPDKVGPMATKVEEMLRQALDSLVHLDSEMARQVIAQDDLVDTMHESMFEIVNGLIKEHPERAADLLSLLSVSRYLERSADHATNIAEDVIYLVEGDIVRHQASNGG